MRGVKGPGPVYDEFRREPMDWYASEQGPGMTHWFKPANRNNRPNDGVSVEEQERDGNSLLNYYRHLGRLRSAHPALRSTQFRIVERIADCPACLGFWRWSDDELVMVVFNLGEQPATVFIDTSSAPLAPGGQPVALRGDPQSAAGSYAIQPLDYALILWRR